MKRVYYKLKPYSVEEKTFMERTSAIRPAIKRLSVALGAIFGWDFNLYSVDLEDDDDTTKEYIRHGK